VVEGLRLARTIASGHPLTDYISAEYLPGPGAETDDDLIAHSRQKGQTLFHPTSTCAMGVHPGAVLDQRLRVHGVGGLRVADCSVMPTLVSGNTNAPAVMIGEKAADLVLQQRGTGKSPL
jgi:choline dehydrogenase